ncbi:MAG: hypothetical protein HWD92_10405 [Flavobacteriia bacterium]|nr:hypothetical protein [Flavobacteriia bacterium]
MKTKQIELILIGLAGILIIAYLGVRFGTDNVELLSIIQYAIIGAIGLYVAYVFISQQRDKVKMADMRDKIESLEAKVAEHESTIASQKSQIGELESNLEAAEKKADKLDADFKKAKKAWETEKKELQSKIPEA